MGEDFSPPALRLCGYAKLGRTGFALPCYASGVSPNTWYTATCSVAGDHAGHVTRFDAFSGQDVVRLPEELTRTVGVGDPWCDVFLWKDEPFVGRPSEIWAQLERHVSEIQIEAPVSLLDLALYGKEDAVVGLAKLAYSFVQRQFGSDRAAQWRQRLLLRPMVIRSIQRLVQVDKLSLSMIDARGVDVTEEGNVCRVELSPEIAKKIVEGGHVDEVFDEVHRLAAGLALDLRITEANGVVVNKGPPEEPSQSVEVEASTDESKPITPLTDAESAQDILVVVCGRSGERIAKFVRAPRWYPQWGEGKGFGVRPYEVVDARRFDGSRADKRQPQIRIIRSNEIPNDIGSFAVAIYVGSERHLSQVAWAQGGSGVLSPHMLPPSCVKLGAPILPVDRPHDGLDMLLAPAQMQRAFAAIVDTSLLKSPTYSRRPNGGSAKVAELIVCAAVLCAGGSALRNYFLSHQRPEATPLLSLGTELIPRGIDARRSTVDLASEMTWGATDEFRRSTAVLFRSTFGAAPTGSARKHFGYVEVRQQARDFPGFARHVLQEVGLSHLRSARSPFHSLNDIRSLDVPESILNELRFGDYVAGFALGASTDQAAVAILGETPTLRALLVAQTVGWQLMRYTDVESLLEFLSLAPSASRNALPYELSLPRANRLIENQGLFERGIANYDVVELDASLETSFPSRIDAGVRRYRVPVWGASGKSVSVVPSTENLGQNFNALSGFAPTAREALRTAWNRPASGVSRFAFATGFLPIQLMELPDGDIAHSSLFWVDGTEAAVRSLLESRVFYIWFRAYAYRGIPMQSSWKTVLETFPISPPFSVQRLTGYRPYLFLDKSAHEILSLARQVAELPANLDLRRVRRRILPYQPTSSAKRAIDAAILDAYGMPSSATDAEVLVKLIEINNQAKTAKQSVIR